MVLEASILILLLILSGVFSGMEIALFSLTDAKVKALQEEGVKNSKTLAEIKSKPERLLSTILVGNNVVNIGASSYATLIATNAFGNSGAGIAVGIMTLLVLIFGEITPKAIASAKNVEISLSAARPMQIFMKVLFPIVWGLEKLTGVMLKLAKAPSETLVSEEEVKAMITQGAKTGAFDQAEHELLENVFDFDDLTALDAMTVYKDIFAVDGEKTLGELLKKLVRSPYSRIPVFKGEKAHIVGVLRLREVLKYIGETTSEGKLDLSVKIADLAAKPFFVPESKLIDELLHEFKKRHKHLAIVVNEYGDTVGLITMEDILEQLVGSIVDETDVENDIIKRVDKHTIIVDGSEELGEINDFFNVAIVGHKNNSISWKILQEIGSIPQVGDSVEFDEVLCEVTQATDRSVEKVKITKLDNKS